MSAALVAHWDCLCVCFFYQTSQLNGMKMANSMLHSSLPVINRHFGPRDRGAAAQQRRAHLSVQCRPSRWDRSLSLRSRSCTPSRGASRASRRAPFDPDSLREQPKAC